MRVSASLAAGGAAEKAATIFRKHDLNQDNHLNRQEMLQALDEIGVLNGIKAKHVGACVHVRVRLHTRERAACVVRVGVVAGSLGVQRACRLSAEAARLQPLA